MRIRFPFVKTLPKKLLPYGILSKQGRRIHFYTNLMSDTSVELQCLLYFYASGSSSWAPYGQPWAFLAQEQGSNVGFNWGVDEQPAPCRWLFQDEL